MQRDGGNGVVLFQRPCGNGIGVNRAVLAKQGCQFGKSAACAAFATLADEYAFRQVQGKGMSILPLAAFADGAQAGYQFIALDLIGGLVQTRERHHIHLVQPPFFSSANCRYARRILVKKRVTPISFSTPSTAISSLLRVLW